MSNEIHDQNPGEFKRLVWLAVVTLTFILINSITPLADYLTMRWPDVALGGIFFFGFFLIGRLVQVPEENLDRVLAFNSAVLIAYLAHQFEEHGVDLYGRVYYFHGYANAVIAERGLSLTPLMILKINSVAVWFACFLALWGGRRYNWPGLVAAGLVICNGMLHIALAITKGEYNPGLLTSIVVFLPLAVLYFRMICIECNLGWKSVVGGIAFAAASHYFLPTLIGIGVPVLLLTTLVALPLIANVIWVHLVIPKTG